MDDIFKNRIHLREAIQEIVLGDFAETKGSKGLENLANHTKIMFTELHAANSGEEDTPYLRTLVESIMDRHKLFVVGLDRDDLMDYYVDSYVGYGTIQQYIYDRYHSDIKLSGRNRIAVKSAKGWQPVNVEFSTDKDYEDFIERCFRKLNQTFNTANPIQNAMDPKWGIRLNGTHIDITPLGSQLVIRKRLAYQLSTDDLYKSWTINDRLLAFFKVLMAMQESAMVYGGQNSGKTTMLGWMLDLIPPEIWVNTHEDTPELFLKRVSWTSHITRPQIGNDNKPVTQADLAQNFYRESGQVVVIGEARDESMYDLLNAASGGSTAFVSVHAEDEETVMERSVFLAAPAAKGMSADDLTRYYKKFFKVYIAMEDENFKKRVKQVGISDGEKIQPVFERVYEKAEWTFNSYPEWFINKAKRIGLPTELLVKAGIV